MKQDFGQGFDPDFAAAGQFSAKVEHSISRSHRGCHLERVGWDRIKPWIDQARGDLALASDEAICAVLAKNPETIRLIVDARGEKCFGFFAYLPLNERGASALVAGDLVGARPDPGMVCAAGERPEAIYLWLTYAPGRLARAMGAIGECIDELAPDGCAIFSRAVNPHAERLNRSVGFQPASQFYPGAPGWLLVSLPEMRSSPPELPPRRDERKKPVLSVRCVKTLEDLMKVFAVRSATYMAEQLCLYSEEFDGNDFCGTHLLGLVDGEAAGCARIRYFGEFAKLERVAVLPKYRNTRLAYRLARTALNHCRRKGFPRVYGHSRADLVRFWNVFGFRVVEDSEPFSFANVEYREIVVDLEPDAEAIRWGGDPMIAIRQEGHWDEQGPLELSNLHASDEVAAQIRQNSRMLRA
ncbi:GNAT family N-acetyltransferase [Parasphingopyxis marina]|nr:GNAT family N-acetyltransferase [Parasphingopyxis marina]